MDRLATLDNSLPKPIAQLLAGIGLLYVSAKVFTFVRLLASLLILPGAPV
jgi:hypothetical protein